MIKCETENGNMSLEVKGNIKDIATDSAYIIVRIYRSMLSANKSQAKEYKTLILQSLDKVFEVVDEKH